MSLNTEEKEGSRLILVTGATGTIGRRLIDLLLGEDAAVGSSLEWVSLQASSFAAAFGELTTRAGSTR